MFIRVILGCLGLAGGGAAAWYFGFRGPAATANGPQMSESETRSAAFVPAAVALRFGPGSNPAIACLFAPVPSESPSKKIEPIPETLPPVKDLSDDLVRRVLVGDWEQTDKGRWELHAKPDGTCLLIYEPSFVRRLLLGKRVEIDMKWEFSAGTLTLTSLSGRPETSYKTIVKQVGRVQKQKLIGLKRNWLHLTKPDGTPDTPWTRIKEKKKE